MEKTLFIPVGMPGVYFEHAADTLSGCLCLTDERTDELGHALAALLTSQHDGTKGVKFSEDIEKALQLAKNEQERVWVLIQLGCAKAKFFGDRGGIKAVGSSDIPDDVKEEIMKALLKRLMGGK